MANRDAFSVIVDEHGYPADKSYLEANLPDTLQRGIDELNACDNPCRVDLYQDELYGDINREYIGGMISDEVAKYLRKKYLSSDYIPLAMRKKNTSE